MTFIVLELGLAVYKWKAAQWTLKLATVNAIIHVLGAIAFIVIASNPNLINEAIIPYMAELTEITSSSVAYAMEWIRWIVVGSVIVTIVLVVFYSYRKARIR